MIQKLRGFTLVEIVIVLIVIAILAAGSYILWPGLTINLAAQTQELVNDIRYTQSLSMTSGQRYYLYITSSTTYQIKDSSGTAIVLPNGSTTMTMYSGITIGARSNLPNNVIGFDGQGMPYVTTTIPGTALSSTATIPLTLNGETRTISIQPQTGNVSYQ